MLAQTYQQLEEALERRLGVIGDIALREHDPSAHLSALRSAFEGIAHAADRLDPPVPAELAHYLKGGSYDKALAWLRAQQVDS